jgi:prepilin-type N-terminal cleavage/methylation domain-containing protein
MKTSSSTTRTAAAQQGYTLVELLVAISLGSVVLASLGGVLLVSEMKVSAKIQRNLDAKDAANRAIDLMRREAKSSLFLTNSLSRSEVSPNCWRTSPVVYYQTNGSKICYKTVAPNWEKLPPAYQNVYQGPCLLVREGPPYKPDGEIDNLSSSIQVVLDGVAKTSSANCSSRSNQGLLVTVGQSNRPDQKATIEINLDRDDLDYKFSIQRPSNPAYDGISLYDDARGGCTSSSKTTTGCGTSTYVVSHRPESYSSYFQDESCPNQFDICGSSSKETVIYFVKPFSQYALSDVPGSESPCTYAKCYAQETNGTFSVRLSNVDHLVFPDKEFRPSS